MIFNNASYWYFLLYSWEDFRALRYTLITWRTRMDHLIRKCQMILQICTQSNRRLNLFFLDISNYLFTAFQISHFFQTSHVVMADIYARVNVVGRFGGLLLKYLAKKNGRFQKKWLAAVFYNTKTQSFVKFLLLSQNSLSFQYKK